jgi:hypothetical protein
MKKFIKYEAEEGVLGACVSRSRAPQSQHFSVCRSARRTFDLGAKPHVKEPLERVNSRFVGDRVAECLSCDHQHDSAKCPCEQLKRLEKVPRPRRDRGKFRLLR